MKKNILKCINPLEIVKSLKGNGVNPAVKRIPSQEIKPPLVENFSFKKFGSSYPYSSNILNPISLKKIYPIKYPKSAPRTEKIVATAAIRRKSFFLATTIGIIITSGGIGKKELSIKETKAKIGFAYL